MALSPSTVYTVSALGAVSTATTSDGSVPQTINVATQTAAILAGAKATLSVNPVNTGAAILTAEVATSAATSVLVSAASNAVSNPNASNVASALSDLLTVAGDGILVLSAFSNTNPEAKEISLILDVSGTAVTAASIALNQFNVSTSTNTQVSAFTQATIKTDESLLQKNEALLTGQTESAMLAAEQQFGVCLAANSTAIGDLMSNSSSLKAATNSLITASQTADTQANTVATQAGVVGQSNTTTVSSTSNSSGNVATIMANSSTGGSQVTNLSSSGSGAFTTTSYAGANDTQAVQQLLTSNANGTVSETLYNPSSTVASIQQLYSSLQNGGDLMNQTSDYVNGTSALAVYNPSSATTSQTSNYTGLNGTGTLTSVLTDAANGTSDMNVFKPTSTVSSQDTFYSGTNGTGSETRQVTDNTSGTSSVEAVSPSGGVASVVDDYSGLNGAGALLNVITDNTSGTSSIETLNPTGAISSLTYDYAGLNGTGAATFAIQDNANGTAVDTSYNTPGTSGVVWNYNAGGVLTTEQLYTLSGETYNYTYNAGSWVGNLTIAAPTFTQVQVYTSPNVMSELTDNYSNGNTYAGYYATGTAGDPLTQTITGTVGVAIVTSDFDTAAAGDPIGTVQVQQPNGVVSDYGYAYTLPGDPLTTLISNVPNNYVATYSYDDAIAADPLDQLIVQSVNGAVDKAAYDVSGGSWSSAVADYNSSGIETELETDYTNNTAINQVFDGQAQGWTGQEFWYSAGIITQNTINFTNGVAYDLTYASGSLYTYLINNPGAGYYSLTTENLGGQPWNSCTSFYTSAGIGYESVAAYNGFSILDGNSYVVGNNADVPVVGDDDADSGDYDPLGIGGDGSDGGDGSSGDGSSGAPGNPDGGQTISPDALQVKSVTGLPNNSSTSSSASSTTAPGSTVANKLGSGPNWMIAGQRLS